MWLLRGDIFLLTSIKGIRPIVVDELWHMLRRGIETFLHVLVNGV
jgi:hypothetical protein